MKIEELRIGNLLLINGKPRKIVSTSLYKSRVSYLLDNCNYSEGHSSLGSVFIQGIPLTQESVLAIGFIYGESFNIYYKKIDGSDGHFYLNSEFQPEILTGIRKEFKYIHEIQNLYHAISGKELLL